MTIAGRWLHLDPRWNQQYSSYLLDSRTLGITPRERTRLLSDPFIVHYSGATKPWTFENDHPLRHLYYRHLRNTPYAGWRPRAAESRQWLKKLMSFAVPHRLRPALLGW
jgi:lipopolysaccharide biosynthesis glycosyltransferase